MQTILGSTGGIIVGQARAVDVGDVLHAQGVQGAFLVEGYGFWKGSEEIATYIKIDGANLAELIKVAEALRVAFHQDCVLVEHEGRAILV